MLFPLQGEALNNQLEPGPLPEEPRLSPAFLVNQMRVERSNVEEERKNKKAEQRVRGIASRTVTIEHHHPFSCGIQSFIKFFLGGPNKPHKVPVPPSNAKKDAQYWVEKRSQFISNQLALIRESLSDKSVPEQDFFVRQAKEEIRKQIKTPPFTPAPKVGDFHGSGPISCATKGDVERELAQAGISRMTYEWMLGPAEDSPWNLAVVEVMSRKSIEWMRLSTRIDDDMVSQAPTIVQRWLCGKCQEIQKNQNQDA
jgi:hypothetical protein